MSGHSTIPSWLSTVWGALLCSLDRHEWVAAAGWRQGDRVLPVRGGPVLECRRCPARRP